MGVRFGPEADIEFILTCSFLRLRTFMDAYQFYRVAPAGMMLVTTGLNFKEYSLAAVESELPAPGRRQAAGLVAAATSNSDGATNLPSVSKDLSIPATSAQAALRTSSEQSLSTARYAPNASCIM